MMLHGVDNPDIHYQDTLSNSFPERFPKSASEGFDIVLANPPYIRQELIKDIKPALKKVFGPLFCGTADLYCYFYIRAVQLLRPGGMLSFISSNKWFRANYGKTLRAYVVEHCHVSSITDFGELPVFQTASTFPMIFVASKGKHDNELPGTTFTQVDSFAPPYPNIQILIRQKGIALAPSALSGSDWALTNANTSSRIEKMKQNSIPLGEYVNGQIFRGVLTGFNQAFIIDGRKRAELIEKDPKSEEIIKPFAAGDDIRKWQIRNRDKWIIITKMGIEIESFPAVLNHLSKFRKELNSRQDKGDYWWELRSCTYYDCFEQNKIVFPDIAKESRFHLDTERFYQTNSAYIIPHQNYFLVGLLNSTPVWEYCSERLTVMGDSNKRGRLRFFTQFVQNLPIPVPKSPDENLIASLACKCISSKGENCETWEREIDERVSALYGL